MVSWLELRDPLSDPNDNAGDVIAFICRAISPFGELPVLGIRSGNDDLDQDLVRSRSRNRRVNNKDLWTWRQLGTLELLRQLYGRD